MKAGSFRGIAAGGSSRSGSICLLNAAVVTRDPERPQARAVAVRDGCITAIGADAEARAAAGPGATLVDCNGGTVLPGFVDAHVHLLALARALVDVDLSPERVTSLDALCARLRSAARPDEPATWIRAYGYDEFYLRERRHPTRYDVDAAVPTQPVRLRHRTRHASVLNSAALRYVGEKAPELLCAPGVQRDQSSGEPTGVLFDLDASLTALLPTPTSDETRAALARASDRLLASGVTAVDDASPTTGPETATLLWDARRDSIVRQRIRLLWGAARYGMPDDPRVSAIKLVLADDGSHDPSFEALLMDAHRLGLQVAVHAVEGPALTVAVAAFEEALRRWPRAHRHRLEHCAVCPPPLAERIARLGLTVVAQPGFLHRVGERYLSEVPQDEHAWLYPLRSLAACGVRLAGSSDAPVGPLAPLVGIAAAVDRRAATGAEVTPEEAIALGPAVDLYCGGAAHASYREHQCGRLAVGRPADLVVFPGDLCRLLTGEIGAQRPALVVMDGRPLVTHPTAAESIDVTAQTEPEDHC